MAAAGTAVGGGGGDEVLCMPVVAQSTVATPMAEVLAVEAT